MEIINLNSLIKTRLDSVSEITIGVDLSSIRVATLGILSQVALSLELMSTIDLEEV